jgi:hypothetical protein
MGIMTPSLSGDVTPSSKVSTKPGQHQDGLELSGGESGHGAGGNEDDGAQPTDYHRDLRQRGLHEPDGSRHPQLPRQAQEEELELLWGESDVFCPQALRHHPAPQEPDGEKKRPEKPEGRDPGNLNLLPRGFAASYCQPCKDKLPEAPPGSSNRFRNHRRWRWDCLHT